MLSSTPLPTYAPVEPGWLADFAPIGLTELEAAALMDRSEYKFAFPLAQLPELLLAVGGAYRVLSAGGQTVQGYLSRYYDTATFEAYRAQHLARERRHKLRWRLYRSTGASFLEIKRRERGVTRKTRVPAPHPQPTEQAEFLATHAIDPTVLRPVIDVECSRITLVRVHPTPERLTLDLNLRLISPETGECHAFGKVVIAELKCPGALRATYFHGIARQLGLRGGSLSKFGVGCALHYPQLKHNLLLPQLRQLHRLQARNA
ncbi:polyphosphate polymerase domain-containing protein [Deinococcus sp. QL22]|uniref:polyphosphate polymerase domain-containing protein n=1 Tax=Deinococcus sp. QL22 TaxID=2939437 RepID=UPI00201806DA|nr:polyphosphate polymerase domain-containing protein [Deinococcus sp. QL22]UQN08246.1 polyphosphate polymerase domain-containing protein [Deinococcus sp. QL22]